VPARFASGPRARRTGGLEPLETSQHGMEDLALSPAASERSVGSRASRPRFLEERAEFRHSDHLSGNQRRLDGHKRRAVVGLTLHEGRRGRKAPAGKIERSRRGRGGNGSCRGGNDSCRDGNETRRDRSHSCGEGRPVMTGRTPAVAGKGLVTTGHGPS